MTSQPSPPTRSARLLSALARAAPAPVAHMALRMREVVDPQPVSWDEAAVQLRRAERRGRGILPYPYYLYGMLSAARTALAVGSGGFTAMEFGVAGGNGLRAMERHAEYIERLYPLSVSVVGFDSGGGMLPATDPRDCAFALPAGAFAMDEAKLRGSLGRAELVLGPVQETVAPFMAGEAGRKLPPIGFVSIDLDVYTGTLAALHGITQERSKLLPRVTMYFDDLSGYPYSTEVGERAAIRDFNESSGLRIGQVENLEHQIGGSARLMNWPRHIFVLYVFDDPAYNASEVAHLPNTTLR